MKLPDLPGDYVCDGCGETADDFAVIRPLSEMDVSERDTLEVYGKWEGDRLIESVEGMFTNGEEVEICGCCGGSYWSKPKSVASNEKSHPHDHRN